MSDSRVLSKRSCTTGVDTAKIGLSHRISQLLNQSHQRFSYGRDMHADYKTGISFAENENCAATRPKLDDIHSFGILAF